MKKIFLILLVPAFCFFTTTPKPVTIQGHLQFSSPVQMVFLSYRAGSESIKDSTVAVNGKFKFSGKLEEPTMATLYVRLTPAAGSEKPRYDGMQLFIEPGNINIDVKDSMQFAKVTGSRSEKVFKAFNDSQKSYDEKEMALSNQYREYSKAKDEAGMKKISDDFDALTEEKNEKVYHQYLIENPTSPIALYVLDQYAGYDIDAKKMEPIFEALPVATRSLPSGVEFKNKIETAKKTGIGAYAMDFTQNDTLGKPVSLSSFKGKYVLLDFWASWCGPCRAENPNVVKAFNQYKDKNFTVLSVSLDQPGKQQAWVDAIHKDGLWWNHVSDLKFWDNAVAKQYGIKAIPQNLLLDPSGKIIAKNIRGEELNKKLAEVLN